MSEKLRICFISPEIMAHGDFGGFGALTKDLARGLAKKHTVYVIVPNRKDYEPFEEMHGFKLVAHPSGVKNFYRSKLLYELVNADIYQSEEPSVGSYMAMRAMENRKHIITFQDPRYQSDVRYEWDMMGEKGTERIRLNLMLRGLYFYSKKAVKKADRLAVQAWYAEKKSREIYGVKKSKKVPFLPNPVEIPNRNLKKSGKPTVCFLGRFNQRKRLEFFCQLTKKFPDVEFIVMGKPESDNSEYGEGILKEYKDTKNLEFVGFVSEEQKSKILEKSWILLNTSWRECLPVAYLEAAAHKCSIISHENPDDFPLNFGYHNVTGTLNEFEKGLEWVLKEDRWKKRGELAYQYVKKHHEFDKVIKLHEKLYMDVLEND